MALATIYCLGSLNLDFVYHVPHFVRPGETLGSTNRSVHLGGKGLNQSIALSRAGAHVTHIGCVGRDGEVLRHALKQEGVLTTGLKTHDLPSGHAIIQVDAEGENAIILHSGANHTVSKEQIVSVLKDATHGDWMLLQNETNCVGEAMALAKEVGLNVAFNPAPMTDAVLAYPLHHVDLLIVNETEAGILSGLSELSGVLDRLGELCPNAQIVVTLGKKGALFLADGEVLEQRSRDVEVVDTTAAGDTFTGYLLASLASGEIPSMALNLAADAAALCVTRNGAADSIPRRHEV